jgi:hypothetical protein
MKDYVQVEGHSGLVRDKKSGAILNINSTDIEKARKAKALKRKSILKNEILETQVHDLQNEMVEVKGLLNKILEKL